LLDYASGNQNAGTVFYNETGDRLSLLRPATSQTLKPGGVNAGFIGSGTPSLPTSKASLDAIISQPFSKAR
jgi:hypothetical protein